MAGGVGPLDDEVLGDPEGLVEILADLVLDDAALFVEPGLADGPLEVAHPVRFHPQDEVEGGRRDVLEVVRPVLVGRPVEVRRSDLLHRLEVVVVVVLAPVEHQVLEEVGEPRPAGLLVLRADVVPDVEGDDGRLVVLVDDQGQPVVEDEFLIRDVDLGRLGRPRGRGRSQDDDEGRQDGRAESHVTHAFASSRVLERTKIFSNMMIYVRCPHLVIFYPAPAAPVQGFVQAASFRPSA